MIEFHQMILDFDFDFNQAKAMETIATNIERDAKNAMKQSAIDDKLSSIQMCIQYDANFHKKKTGKKKQLIIF